MRNPIHNAIELVSERKLVTCKRCNAPDLAWVKLKTTGKWSLVNTSFARPFYHGENSTPEAPRGYRYAIKMSYHSCIRYQQRQQADQAQLQALRDAQSVWRDENGHTATEMLQKALVSIWLRDWNPALHNGEEVAEYIQLAIKSIGDALSQISVDKSSSL